MGSFVGIGVILRASLAYWLALGVYGIGVLRDGQGTEGAMDVKGTDQVVVVYECAEILKRSIELINSRWWESTLFTNSTGLESTFGVDLHSFYI